MGYYMTKDPQSIFKGMYMAGVTEIARKLGFCRQIIYNKFNKTH